MLLCDSYIPKVSHPHEWTQYMRQVTNRRTFPVELGPSFNGDRTALFNMWMDNNKSFADIIGHRRETSAGWIAVKKRNLGDHYPDEQALKMYDLRKKQGLFYKDCLDTLLVARDPLFLCLRDVAAHTLRNLESPVT